MSANGVVTEAPPSPVEERAVAFFGVWMMTGLFIDGWAHQSDKPETFFSPWHGILYSGFITAVCWFAWRGYRSGRGLSAARGLDRLTTAGLLMFAGAGIADGIWHEIFGVEADLEALVSPSHLALFFGGFLMVSGPLRVAEARLDHSVVGARRVSWSEWFPQAITLTLSTALIGFFTMYLSPFAGVGGSRPLTEEMRELEEVLGIASVLVFNALLIAALLFALRRWVPPPGFGALLFGGVAFAMSGLEGFSLIELVLPAVVAGLVADLLIARDSLPRAIAPIASLAMWAGFFATAHISYGLVWTVELWSGSIVLAVATAVLLGSLIPGPTVRPAQDANTAAIPG